MSVEQQFLRNLYEAFNRREIEKILALMQPNVRWANGMEGGFIYGRDAVREYWKRQFEVIKPELEPLKFETDDDNRSIVTVRLKVRDLEGNLLTDKTVEQIFTFTDDLISVFEISHDKIL